MTTFPHSPSVRVVAVGPAGSLPLHRPGVFKSHAQNDRLLSGAPLCAFGSPHTQAEKRRADHPTRPVGPVAVGDKAALTGKTSRSCIPGDGVGLTARIVQRRRGYRFPAGAVRFAEYIFCRKKPLQVVTRLLERLG